MFESVHLYLSIFLSLLKQNIDNCINSAIGMAQQELTKALVQNRLDYGIYESAHVRESRRPLFRSHQTMHKI